MKTPRIIRWSTGAALSLVLLLGMFSAIIFPTMIQVKAAPENWWNEEWPYRKLITIDSQKVAGSLENYPVLVNIKDSQLAAGAKADGSDIAFVDTNGSQLDHQIESYNQLTGYLVAWVRLPVITDTADTGFYMYYGNSQAPPQQNRAGVWASTFVMVQHLSEQSGYQRDSSMNENDASPSGGVTTGVESKIDGGDVFNGATGYLEVQDKDSLSGYTSFTASFWVNMHTLWRRQVFLSKYNTVSGQLGWFIDYQVSKGLGFFISPDGINYKPYFAPFAPVKNVWYSITVTWSSNQIPSFYINGIKVSTSGTLKASAIFENSGEPLEIARCTYDSTRYLDGALDEIRLSNTVSSAGWILTSYNNQADSLSFSVVGSEENLSGAPIIIDEQPSNNSTDVYTNPTLSAYVADPTNGPMTIVFRNNATGFWKNIRQYDSAANGIYEVVPEDMNQLGATYWWSVTATSEGQGQTTKYFSFTVTTNVLTMKWVGSNLPRGASGVLTYDVNNDGVEEVFYAGGYDGSGSVTSLNGKTGAVIWSVDISGLDEGCQPQMADLTKDGVPELIVPIQAPAGIQVFFANNGSTYWKVTNLGGQSWASPVVGDIDGSGYPTIFISSTDVYSGLNSTGRITALSSNGKLVRQTFVWRPCAGGLSLADTDNDGQFELYMGDRDEYYTSDNDYGQGVQSYWAINLTLRWARPDILSSSHIPMLVDVNEDGVLDIVVGLQRGGIFVLNSTDGSTMNSTPLYWLPVHYQPSVYDIDADGNLEILMADGFHVENYAEDYIDVVIFDLVKWKVEGRMNVGQCKYGPTTGDVTGNGAMDVIAANYTGVFILEYNSSSTPSTSVYSTYYIVDKYTGLWPGILNHAVVQDVDGDGYNEMLITSSGTNSMPPVLDAHIYVFDTPARSAQKRPRSEVQFYSERRLGASEYVSPPGSPNPMVSASSPRDRAFDVPVGLSHLYFDIVSYKYLPMNYTASTQPDVGSGSGTNAVNGHFSIGVVNLAYSTTYSWSVNATDGAVWNNVTFTFTTESNPGWWNVSWPNRKEISIDPAKVSSDQTNFPFLLDFTDPELQTGTRTDGNDIVFTDSNNILLSYNVETFTKSDGHLVAWIRLPFLSSAAYTRFYMYYGNLNAVSQQNVAATWDTNHVMVLHLSETSGVQHDATANDNDGTPYGFLGTQGIAGKIDGSDQFSGTNNYVVVSEGSDTLAGFDQGFTASFWLKLHTATRRQTLLNKYLTSSGKMSWFIDYMPTSAIGTRSLGLYISPDGSNYRDYFTPFNPALNTWYYIAVTWLPGKNPIFYINGLSAKTVAGPNSRTLGPASYIFDNLGVPLSIGRCPYDSNRYLDGGLDEIEISNVSRPAGWILNTYVNQMNSSNIFDRGPVETIPLGPFISNPSPSDRFADTDITLNQLTFSLNNYQEMPMSYIVTTTPNIGSGYGDYVRAGSYSINVSGLLRSTTYVWTITAIDEKYTTMQSYSFTTKPGIPPTQDNPVLKSSSGSQTSAHDSEALSCFNQTTSDPEEHPVTNVYNWYKNGISFTSLLLSFDTNRSANALDYSGYANNAEAVGSPEWTEGVVGGAYAFDNGYFAVPSSSTLDGGGTWSQITVEAWIYLTAAQHNTRIVAKAPSYEMGFNSNGKLFAGVWTNTASVNVSGRYWVTYNTTLNLNTWYHVAFTYKSGTDPSMKLYINGVSKPVTVSWNSGSSKHVGNIQSSSNSLLYIGWWDHFRGKIDEVRIYSSSLSSSQINQRYLDTKNGTSKSSTIVSSQTTVGDVWQCQVIPNDSYVDSPPKISNQITIIP